VHLASFGVLLGGHVFAVEAERLIPALYLTILSGIGLMLLEVYAYGLHWFWLGKGMSVLVKLGILLLVPVFWEHRVLLLLLVVGIASIASHMPARYRHYSFLRRRVVEGGKRFTMAVPKEGVPERPIEPIEAWRRRTLP
jgi:hypothetical protein